MRGEEGVEGNEGRGGRGVGGEEGMVGNEGVVLGPSSPFVGSGGGRSACLPRRPSFVCCRRSRVGVVWRRFVQ